MEPSITNNFARQVTVYCRGNVFLRVVSSTNNFAKYVTVYFRWNVLKGLVFNIFWEGLASELGLQFSPKRIERTVKVLIEHSEN